MIIHKIQRLPQATKPITTNKSYNNQQERSPTVPTTATCKNDKECQGQELQRALHTLQIPVSPSQGKPTATKTGRIIQPNNLLKVFTANVQSLPPKVDELIALIQVENFYVIFFNQTWLDTENKHLLAEVAIQGYKVFHVDKLTPTGRGGGSTMYVKNTLNPTERKSPATCTGEIIQVDINPKNTVHLKLVLIYRNSRITAADYESQQHSIHCWKKFYHDNMNVSPWVTLIFQI